MIINKLKLYQIQCKLCGRKITLSGTDLYRRLMYPGLGGFCVECYSDYIKRDKMDTDNYPRNYIVAMLEFIGLMCDGILLDEPTNDPLSDKPVYKNIHTAEVQMIINLRSLDVASRQSPVFSDTLTRRRIYEIEQHEREIQKRREERQKDLQRQKLQKQKEEEERQKQRELDEWKAKWTAFNESRKYALEKLREERNEFRRNFQEQYKQSEIDRQEYLQKLKEYRIKRRERLQELMKDKSLVRLHSPVSYPYQRKVDPYDLYESYRPWAFVRIVEPNAPNPNKIGAAIDESITEYDDTLWNDIPYNVRNSVREYIDEQEDDYYSGTW